MSHRSGGRSNVNTCDTDSLKSEPGSVVAVAVAVAVVVVVAMAVAVVVRSEDVLTLERLR